MGHHLNIPFFKNRFLECIHLNLAAELTSFGIMANNIALNFDKSSLEDLLNALRSGDIKALAYPLEYCPIFEDDDEICITALSERKFTGEGIMFKNKTYPTHIHQLNKGFKIGLSSDRQLNQLSALFPNNVYIQFINNEHFSLNENFNDLDGIVISSIEYHLVYQKMHEYSYIQIHPTELITAPGNGVVAYLAHKEDFISRKALNKIHCRQSVQVANTERSIYTKSGNFRGDTTGIYCYEDHRGHFHIYGYNSGTDKKARFSQSVSHGLIEKIYQSLFKTNNLS